MPNRYLKTQRMNPVTVPFREGQDLLGFYNNWINSPEYRRRLEQNQYSSPNTVVTNRNNALSNLTISHDTSLPNMSNSPGTPRGQSFVNINRDEIDRLGASVDSVTAHEVSHAIGANSTNNVVGLNEYENELLRSSIINRPSRERSYISQPAEMKADLDATRWKLFNQGIFDISSGDQFSIDHLNKARESLKEDDTFNRLIDQVGDDNYINLMNTIASNEVNNNIQMVKYGGYINPMRQEQFALGGFANMLSGLIPQQNKQGLTSIGGSVGTGALKGAGAGAMFGPIGAGIGAVIGGGLGLLQGNKQRQEEERQLQVQRDVESRNNLSMMNYGATQSGNLPMAFGGVNPVAQSNMGDFNSFVGGGTHEQNPNGGIPIGTNSETGQQITAESGETQYNFKEGKYIFSNRLRII